MLLLIAVVGRSKFSSLPLKADLKGMVWISMD